MIKAFKTSSLLLFFLFFSVDILAGYEYVWTQKANFGGIARHRGSAFVIGNKGYIGLGHINATGNILFEDFWEYDPASNTWTQKANFGGGLRYHTSSFAIGNKAYVGMGRDPFNVYHNDLWEFDPSTNSWTQMASMPGLVRRGAVGFEINNKGYIATGEIKVSPYRINDLWEYNPVTNNWAQKANMPTSGRNSAVGFSIGGLGYVGTGRLQSTGWSTNDLWAYNPISNSWTQKANIGTTTRMEATAFVLNGKGYIGTGDNTSSGTNYGDMWEFDPVLNTCTQIQDFAGTKRRYMLSFSIGDKAYAGTGTNGTNFDDFWEYSEIFVGVDKYEVGNFSVNIFPNPCNTKSTIEIDWGNEDNLSEYLFTIFDMSGKKVKEISSQSPAFIFDRNGIENGLYIYQLSVDRQHIKSGKIILN